MWTSPTMTSNSTPSPYAVFASSEASEYWAAWYALDNAGGVWSTSNGNPADVAWWKIYLGGASVRITTLTIRNHSPWGLNGFKLQGSDDDDSWTDIYAGNCADNSNNQTFNSLGNTAYYLFYRIWCVSGYSTTDGLAIQEFVFSGEELIPIIAPNAPMTLTPLTPTTFSRVYSVDVASMTLVGEVPTNGTFTFIPLSAMTLLGLSPNFGPSPFLVPVSAMALLSRNPSYIWAIPLSQQSAAKVIFSCTLTGAPDGLSDLTLPMSSFQARMRDGDPSYVSVVVPSSATYAADIVARANGEIVIKKGFLMRDGSAQMEEIARVDYESIQIDQGAQNDSLTLAGHKTVTSTVASERTMTGVSYYGLQANGKRRVRANLNLFLRCGDVCIYGTGGNDYMIVGNISYYVAAEPASIYMEVGEA